MLTFMLFYCWQKSRNSRVFWCVNFLAQKSGRVKCLTNFKSGARTDDEGVCPFLQCCPDSGNNNDNTLTPFAQIDLDDDYC